MRCSTRLLSLALLAMFVASPVLAADDQWGLKAGAVELQSAGPMAFGPEGILFVGDTKAATVYALKTSDSGKDAAQMKVNVEGLPAKVAQTLGVGESDVKIGDMAVNPTSGNVYLTVTASGKPAIVKVGADGKLAQVSLKDVPHAKTALKDAPDSAPGGRGDPRDESVTDLAYREGKLLVSGRTKGQASSAVREFAFPFGEGQVATNIEIYHAAHGKTEDNATVRAFVSLNIDGEPTLLAGFTCTPLVKIPLKSLDGKKAKGTTVAELGNRNKPLDMVVYKKDGKSYVLMANSARGVMKISLDNIGQNKGLNEPVRGGGTAGQPFETIKDLTGVEHLDLLNENHAVVLAKSDKGTLNLTTVALP